MKLVVLGLSLSSSWGNGHATTYRALLSAFAARGHDILFLERDVPWYASARDLPDPDFCRLAYYAAPEQLVKWQAEIEQADAVIIGSYVPDGIAVIDMVRRWARGATAFYDIDTPVTMRALEEGRCDFLAARQIAQLDAYLSFTGGPTLECIEALHGSPMARALYCSADTARYHPVPVPTRWDLSYLGTYSPDRQPVLDRLLLEPARRAPERRFVVAGSQYPDDIVWPANVQRIEHLPPADHPAFYCASRFTLNVTRADMVEAGWSPSVRLFEAAACATPIIGDVWDGIEDIFVPGREIGLVRDADEVLALLETDAAAMGAAAHARLLREHSAERRAATLEAHLLEAIARSGKTNTAVGKDAA